MCLSKQGHSVLEILEAMYNSMAGMDRWYIEWQSRADFATVDSESLEFDMEDVTRRQRVISTADATGKALSLYASNDVYEYVTVYHFTDDDESTRYVIDPPGVITSITPP